MENNIKNKQRKQILELENRIDRVCEVIEDYKTKICDNEKDCFLCGNNELIIKILRGKSH